MRVDEIKSSPTSESDSLPEGGSTPRRILRKVVSRTAARSVSPLEPSDDSLIEAVRRGDKSAYRTLVERYQERLFVVANQVLRSREDALDVVQESFVKAYLSIDSFKGESSFFTWLYRIALNMSIDLRRKRARQGGATLSLETEGRDAIEFARSDTMGTVEGPHEAAERREQSIQIQEGLKGMSEDHRAVLVLRELEGLRYEQIAKMLGISKGTVMSRLHYGRKKLQEFLKRAGLERPGREVDSESNAQVERQSRR